MRGVRTRGWTWCSRTRRFGCCDSKVDRSRRGSNGQDLRSRKSPAATGCTTAEARGAGVSRLLRLELYRTPETPGDQLRILMGVLATSRAIAAQTAPPFRPYEHTVALSSTAVASVALRHPAEPGVETAICGTRATHESRAQCQDG